jgi:putative hemolysin
MMLQTKAFTLIISIILLAAFLLGCAPEVNPPAESPSGMANPASIYCQGLGFREESRQNELGQYGVCIFPDGTECDTWNFLSGRCGQEHSYCVSQGYEIEAKEASSIATCTFDDGSTCSEFLFFEGECKPGNQVP